MRDWSVTLLFNYLKIILSCHLFVCRLIFWGLFLNLKNNKKTKKKPLNATAGWEPRRLLREGNTAIPVICFPSGVIRVGSGGVSWIWILITRKGK